MKRSPESAVRTSARRRASPTRPSPAASRPTKTSTKLAGRKPRGSRRKAKRRSAVRRSRGAPGENDSPFTRRPPRSSPRRRRSAPVSVRSVETTAGKKPGPMAPRLPNSRSAAPARPRSPSAVKKSPAKKSLRASVLAVIRLWPRKNARFRRILRIPVR